MIILLKIATGESICGELLESNKEMVTLRRPLYFHAWNEGGTIYDATMLSLLKYDFISDTERVSFNTALVVSATQLFLEAEEWYKAVADFIFDHFTVIAKANLVEMAEYSKLCQTKILEAMAKTRAEKEANTPVSNGEVTDASWADKVDTKIQN